jgi:hypothetical protein
MTPKDLTEQVSATYRMLRLGLAIVAFSMPPLLYFCGKFFGDLPLDGSISAYYHLSAATPGAGLPGQGLMRNEFVGLLFAVSAFLLAYQGYSKLEDWALNAAGVLALGVALVPMKWSIEDTGSSFSLHGTCAVLFFVAIGYVCIFRAGDTLTLIHDQAVRRRYQRAYRWLGVAMIVLPLAAWGLLSLLPAYRSTKFFVEVAGIYVFATYWVLKSHEASKTGLDNKAVRGALRARSYSARDAFRPLPVSYQGPV